MKNYFSLSFLIFLLAIIALTGCKKENSNLGLNVQPPSDKLELNRVDTVSITAYSKLVDTVRTNGTTLSLWGAINDPIFGKTTASIYTQLKLTQTAFDWGTNPVSDSLMLSLLYAGSYGDSTAYLRIKVYEMDDTIGYTTPYYSFSTVPVKSTLLADYSVKPDLVDSLTIDGKKVPPLLRINLSSLSPELVDKLLAASAADLNTNDDFLKYFYGLYITAETSDPTGRIIYLDLVSSLSGMSLYYHNDEKDSIKFDFSISSSCARFENFTHDYTLADPAFKAQVLNGDTSLGKNTCYMQSMGGVKTFLRFPYLKDFNNIDTFAVNEAKIVFKLGDENPNFRPSSSLALVKADSAGSYSILSDQLTGVTYFGGYYDSLNNEYWFRITNSIQALLKNETPDYGFELYSSGGAVNADRAVIYGTDPVLKPDDRIKLIITYTKVQ